MKFFILLLSVVCIVFASDVDTKLYENGEKESYYEEIQKQIESAEHIRQVPKEIVEEEKLYLKRVRSVSLQEAQIERYDLKTLSEKSINLQNYYNAIEAVALSRVKQEQYSKILRTVNKKFTFFKRAIENIIEDDKARLLSYQLQYAYYKLQEKNIKARTELMKEHEKEVMETLFNALGLLKCDQAESINKKLLQSDKDIEKASLQKVALQIELEKALIEDSAKTEQMKEKIKNAETVTQQALIDKVSYAVQQSACMLNQKKNKPFFKKIDEIKTNIEDISGEQQEINSEKLNILRDIAKEVFGSTKLFFGGTLHESIGILTQVRDYFTSPIFVFNEQPISLLSLFKALVLIVLGFFAGKYYRRWIFSISHKWPDMSMMSVRLASNIGYYIVIIISFMIALGSLGIDMTSISLIAGALSIGIGFGLQTVVSNFIAGIILMFERTIRIGDTIEISDTLRGRVTDMRIRSTTIKTFDNIDIVIPNSSFIQNNVINWTLEDVSRRLHIPFSVAYGSDAREVIDVILNELEQSDLKYIKDNINKQPEVWMVAMGSSSIDFELLVWIEWDSRLRPNSLKSDFLILIYNALNEHGIEIPFPQLDLHVKQMPAEILNQPSE